MLKNMTACTYPVIPFATSHLPACFIFILSFPFLFFFNWYKLSFLAIDYRLQGHSESRQNTPKEKYKEKSFSNTLTVLQTVAERKPHRTQKIPGRSAVQPCTFVIRVASHLTLTLRSKGVTFPANKKP